MNIIIARPAKILSLAVWDLCLCVQQTIANGSEHQQCPETMCGGVLAPSLQSSAGLSWPGQHSLSEGYTTLANSIAVMSVAHY